MRSYPGFCRSKQLEYNPGLTHRRRAGHPRANRRTSDRPSFCGVRPSCSRVIMSCHIFQSTHPLRGATRRSGGDRVLPLISIHAPLAGCDLQARQGLPAFRDFNPRTPCGVRLETRMRVSKPIKFQSTHPLRGATITRTPARRGHGISIHAPLAGCDFSSTRTAAAPRHFNPRTPCGVRQSTILSISRLLEFQSTHPLRGATSVQRSPRNRNTISIHAPLAGCDEREEGSTCKYWISIHAPLAGCDQLHDLLYAQRLAISIHAPLAGCDFVRSPKSAAMEISIHAPLAGCDCSSRRTSACATKFQSTHPLRGATGRGIFEPAQLRISIHAPLAGCDYRA